MLKETAPVYGGVQEEENEHDSWYLLSDNLEQHPLVPFSVEFEVEDLFPGAEVKPSFCNGDHALSAHDSTLQVCIGIVLVAVVLVLAVGLLWCKLLQPSFIISVQAWLIIIDEDTCGDIHGVY